MNAVTRWRPYHYLAFAACVVLYIAVRARWLGHLITWDEAMNILTTRSFVAGGQDYYSGYLWRHPPLLNVLWLVIRPLHDGFIARAEFMAIGIGCAGLAMMTWLNTVVFGPRVALASALCLALMPGEAYFSLWFKQDALLVPLGLAAILCFVRGRSLWCGLFLGLALLAKEMGAFFAIAVGVLWLLRPKRERSWRDLVATGLVAALTCGWWYVLFSKTLGYYVAFATGGKVAAENLELFGQPWHYYLHTFVQDLGPVGLYLAVVGFIVSVLHPASRPAGMWCAALLVPTCLIVSLAKGKAAWYVATLYPAWATLQGLGLCVLILGVAHVLRSRGLRLGAEPAFSRVLQPLLVAVAGVALLAGILRWDFEAFMQKQEMRMWWSANASREAAQTLNRVAAPDERVLVTPMHYNGKVKFPCPIFVVYLKPMPVLVRPNDLSAEAFVSVVKTNQLHWAMVSPPPETGRSELLLPLYREYGIRPIALSGAAVLKTSSLWQQAAP